MLADVRWYLDGRSGRDAYTAGHLPGAVWIDLDAALANPPSPERGRHPLPHPRRFAAGMSAAGIGDETPVVAYDDAGGSTASRLVWLLRALGHPAALLDGDLTTWTGPLESGYVTAMPESFTARAWPRERLTDIDDVNGAGMLIDARAPERYRGEVEPIDPRAGHIPGATNVDWPANLGADGHFLPPAALRARFEAAGIAAAPDVTVYCGSGVTACHTLLALEAAGMEGAKLYPGSWSQWSSDPARPAAAG